MRNANSLVLGVRVSIFRAVRRPARAPEEKLVEGEWLIGRR